MGKQHIIELNLDAMAHGGQALGRLEGKIVFVPGAIPGEVVRARIVEGRTSTSARKRWARAALVSVLEPSPHRVEPPCPYFGVCGGCHWQYIAYEAQLDYKRQVVVDQLQRLGHLQDPPVRAVIGMPEPWSYRNHVQFALSESGHPGLQAARSHDVVPIEQCMVLHPLLDELHAALDVDWPELKRLSLRAGIHTGERMCILETAAFQLPELEVDVPVSCVLRLPDGTEATLIGSSAYHEVVRGKQFRVSASSFFQANTEQTEVLLDIVQAYLDPQMDDTVLDVYCGVGTLGLSVQKEVRRVIGIEDHPAAIADARVNAGDAGDVTFVEGKAEALLPGLQEQVSKVILNPPRRGCRPEGIEALLRLMPRRIVYVSCDPATLARDAVPLMDGGYRLAKVQPVDMFPQTYHVETVSLWRPLE